MTKIDEFLKMMGAVEFEKIPQTRKTAEDKQIEQILCELFDLLDVKNSGMNSWEQEFVNDMMINKDKQELTPKQRAKLYDIASKIDII